MSAEPQSKADAMAPFGSLFELRRAHSELMRAVRDRAQILELTQRIRDFLARAAATGAVLRASDEREAAQNILDYWNASLLTMRGVDRSSFTTVQLEPVDASLAPDLSNKPNPYIGLSVFDEKSADQFYGREEALRILLEPISKSFEEDDEAGKLDKAEEIVGVVLPTNEDPALPLNPSEEALNILLR